MSIESAKAVRAEDDVTRHRVASRLLKAMEADGRFGYPTLKMALALADVAMAVLRPVAIVLLLCACVFFCCSTHCHWCSSSDGMESIRALYGMMIRHTIEVDGRCRSKKVIAPHIVVVIHCQLQIICRRRHSSRLRCGLLRLLLAARYDKKHKAFVPARV